MSPPPPSPPYRRAIVAYDRLYRRLHGLDREDAEIGPALRVEVRTVRRWRRLPDGTRLARNARIGVLHLNNERITRLHGDGLGPMGVGLAFRRQLVASLRALAVAAQEPGPLAEVQALVAVTIFHEGLARLGFQLEPRGPAWPHLVGAYQRALLACLHPGRSRHAGAGWTHVRAHRLWLSRGALLACYGPTVCRTAAARA